MRRFILQSSPARRQKSIDDAREEARRGAKRVSDTVLFGDGIDPTDSMILDVTAAHFEGIAERNKEGVS